MLINNCLIEINEMPEGQLAGRTKIKMTALEIPKSITIWNENGITWVEEYIQDNLESIKSASYKVCFVDDDKTIPSGHGSMEYDEDGNVIFPDSDTVGSILDAYIEDKEINNETKKVLVTEGVLYKQSYPNFVEWLKTEIKNGTVYGSIEINGKGDNKTIVYANQSKNADGTPYFGRQPKIFDFTALAILSSFVEPSDKASQVLEVNSKIQEGENINVKKVKSANKIEINELSYDDISCILSRAFNKTMMSPDSYCSCGYDYCIYKLYPQSSRVIFTNWCNVPAKYYMSTYSIQGNEVSIGDIVEVEMDWKPSDSSEQSVEINISYIKEILSKSNKEGKPIMDEKIIELNQTIADKTVEINSLTTKNTELSEAITKANKTVEELNAKIDSMTVELNSANEELNVFKAEKAEAELNAKKSEVKTYFDVEIPKNKFSEEEVNSLKHFVEEVDLAGLKNAESEICTKKFKEMMAIEKQNNKETEEEVETNSTTTYNFIAFHEKEKKVVKDEFPTFFKE